MSDSDDEPTPHDDPTLDEVTDQTQIAQRHYDPDEDGELTTTIVVTLAEAMDVEPTAVKSPPLYEVIDAPALEETFFGREVAGGSRRGRGSVEFHYNEYLVAVRSDGWIGVYEESTPETA